MLSALLNSIQSTLGSRGFLVSNVFPVTMFAISVPIAFSSTTLALLSWLLLIPGERAIAYRRAAAEGVEP